MNYGNGGELPDAEVAIYPPFVPASSSQVYNVVDLFCGCAAGYHTDLSMTRRFRTLVGLIRKLKPPSPSLLIRLITR